MVIVDNCTMSALQRINRLSLLSCLFSDIIVPCAVEEEFSKRWNERLSNKSIFLKETVPSTPQKIQNDENFIQLGRGEQECILWALETMGLLITDDLKVRTICRKLKIPFIGTLGVCKLGYMKGCFENLTDYLKTINSLSEDLYLTAELFDWAKDV